MNLELYFRIFYSQYDAKVGNYVHGTILGEIGNLCQSINIDIFGKNHALLNYRFKNVLIGHWSQGRLHNNLHFNVIQIARLFIQKLVNEKIPK